MSVCSYNNITSSWLIPSIRISTNDICISTSSVPNFKLAHIWLLIKFCLERPLSHTCILKESLTLFAKVCVSHARWWTTHELWLHGAMCPKGIQLLLFLTYFLRSQAPTSVSILLIISTWNLMRITANHSLVALNLYVWQISFDIWLHIQSVTWRFQEQKWMSIDIYVSLLNVTSMSHA